MIPPVSSLTPPVAPASPSATLGTSSASSGSFASLLGSAVDNLQNTQEAANQASLGAAAGTTSASQVIVATDQAQLATQLTVALQNAALTAFNKVLDM